MSAKGDYYPFGPNMWVANMAYAADVGIESKLQVLLTPYAPVAAGAALLASAVSIATAGKSVLNLASQPQSLMGKFGRAVSVVASGAATSSFRVSGADYLGQPMSETFTLTGTTPIVGNKAFRWVTHVNFDATAATTVNVGVGDKFGLPYAYLDAGVDFADGVKNGTQGTFVTPPLTAQTAISIDPRGTWAPNAANLPNGSRKFSVMYEPRRNDLYGLKHYFLGT